MGCAQERTKDKKVNTHKNKKLQNTRNLGKNRLLEVDSLVE